MIKMKELLKDNDAVTNEIAGQAYVENFALRVFNGADDEDRAGKATPSVQLQRQRPFGSMRMH